MSKTVKQLAIVSNAFEAKQALGLDKENTIIIALNLEAQYYLEKKLDNFDNPAYKFLEKGSNKTYKYLDSRFDFSYKWAGNSYLIYTRDRLGYFLSELDRSYNFSKRLIDYYNPQFIYIGEVKEFPGASVINGSLKTTAMQSLAQEKHIAYKFFKTKKNTFNLRKLIGKAIKLSLTSDPKLPEGKYSLIILAPPARLLELNTIITNLRKMNINIFLLTYNISHDYKKHLDNTFTNNAYFYKEKMLTSSIKREAENIFFKIVKKHLWEKFLYQPHKNNLAVTKLLQRKVKYIIENELLESITDDTLSKEFFKKIKADALLTITDPDPKALSFIRAAKRVGIKTLALQHGAMWAPAPKSVCPVSDQFLVWSRISEKWLRAIKGIERKKMVITQSPFHALKKTRDKTSSKSSTILFLATIVILDNSQISYHLDKLFETLSSLNKKIVIRLHPFQNSQNYQAIARKYPDNVSLDKNTKLHDSIRSSDLVIYEETTAGFDAMLFKKPTIFFNTYTGEDYFDIQKNKASFPILSENDLLQVPQLLKNPKALKKLADEGYNFAIKYLGLDGNGKKIEKAIKEILTNV